MESFLTTVVHYWKLYIGVIHFRMSPQVCVSLPHDVLFLSKSEGENIINNMYQEWKLCVQSV